MYVNTQFGIKFQTPLSVYYADIDSAPNYVTPVCNFTPFCLASRLLLIVHAGLIAYWAPPFAFCNDKLGVSSNISSVIGLSVRTSLYGQFKTRVDYRYLYYTSSTLIITRSLNP